MFDPKSAPPDPTLAGSVMRIAPLDLRQPRFKQAFRGFDKTEVVAFLTEAADDYEHALREIDRRRGVEASLEASIQSLYHALEFIRERDKQPDGEALA